jgi:hypothetical protein
MGNFSAPEISQRSKIYSMARDRNYKVLITSFVIFIFGIVSLYDGIVRPGAQTPAVLVINFLIIGISLYGFYLFLARSRDVFRHPDVKKFLASGDPRHQLDLFEQEYRDGSLKKFRDGFVTRNFVVTQTFYRFRWAHSSEITMAYVERARVSFHRMPLPFLGISTVMVHLGNGTALHINCASKAEAESLLKLLTGMAPSARFGSAIYEKPGKLSEYDAIAQDVANTISQIPGYELPERPMYDAKKISKIYAPAAITSSPDNRLKTTSMAEKKTTGQLPVTLGTAPEVQPASVRQLSKDEMCDKQIKDLYNSMDKEDLALSVSIIDAMGDNMNLAAADILEILLEYIDEPVRVHAAIALGTLGQHSSVEPLIKALDDPSVQVRENAAIALGKIGDQRAVAPLEQVSTKDVRGKKAAVGALARLDQKLGIYNRPDGQTSFFHTVSEKNP